MNYIQIMQRQAILVWGKANKKEVIVEKTEHAQIPEGLVINGFIQDEEAFGEWLKQIANEYNLKGKKITVTVDSTAMIYRQIDTPKLNKEALERNLYFNLSRQLGNVSENIIDYASLESAEEKMLQQLTVFIPNNFVESYRRAFVKAGMKPVCMTTTAQNLIQAYLRRQDRSTSIFAWCSDEICTALLFNEGCFMYCNIFRYDRKVQNASAVLSERISQMIQFQRIKNPQKSIEFIEVGAFGNVEESVQTLSTMFPIPVEAFENPSSFALENFPQIASAAFSIGSVGKQFNLFKGIDQKKFSKEYKQKKTNMFVGGAFVINLIVLVAFCYSAFASLTFQKQKLASLQQEREAISATYTEALGIAAKNQLTQQQITDILAVFDYQKQSNQFSKTLYEQIVAVKPKDVTLTGIASENGTTLTLTCSATNRLSPADFVKNLRETQWFNQVVYTGFSYSDSYQFNIVLALKGGETQ